ncbi:hypothetical protein IWW48_003490 [Coemansia sp. RSA 1200]|nr:hypothetical protein IWW48_003490 [Coemansia sp. RSA 1200]
MSTISTIGIAIPGNKTRVPRIGLGTISMNLAHDVADDEESAKVLNHAIDIGCTFWGTSDVYGFGLNEKLLGRVLKERRDEVFLCTNGKPEYVRKCIKNSLERLDTDHIDLYYMHRMDPTTPIEDTVAAMAELVKEGKVKYIGLFECTAEELRRAYKAHPIAAIQMEYSAWTTEIETNGILDTCRELGVTMVAYSPLGRGFLTGQIRSFDDLPENDYRRGIPRFQLKHFDNNLKLVDAIEAMAKKHGCKPGQLGLAWLLAQEENLVAIPGTKR